MMVPTIIEGAEGADEALVTEPGVKESQTLEGFRRNTAESIITKGHLRHLFSKMFNVAIISGKSLMQQVLGSKDSTAAPSPPKVTVPSVEGEPTPGHQSKALEAPLEDVTERHEVPRTFSLIEKPLDSGSPIQCTWYPGMPNKSKSRSPRHSLDPSVGFMTIGSEEGYKSSHPSFVDTPYVFPAGVEVTDDSISFPIHSLAADLLRNYMLRAEATEAAYAMSLQWAELARITGEFEHEKSSFGKEMRKVREERDSALAEKDRTARKYETLLRSQEELKSNHATTEQNLTSELEDIKADSQKRASDLEKSRDDLARVQSRLDGCMVEKEYLQSRLAKTEDSATSVVEDFKASPEYLELLKRNTATLVRGFCQSGHADFPGITSHFDKYVFGLGEDYMVDLFDNIPDDEDEDLGAEDDEDDEGCDGEDDAE
ncbi:hypothetical protein LIER_24028 [Lithospermum erythrorhizon]|uniref:Uncharacterized protein n=1 Tax=Lithospermum erythrorhizon TaxID=34254 RepID=A0AAV3R3Q0_LITER